MLLGTGASRNIFTVLPSNISTYVVLHFMEKKYVLLVTSGLSLLLNTQYYV